MPDTQTIVWECAINISLVALCCAAVLDVLQEVDGEVQSLYREFQSEKEDLLDSIRLLGHQVLLKDAIIAAFIPQVGDNRPVGKR
jgi:hypothetical protein